MGWLLSRACKLVSVIGVTTGGYRVGPESGGGADSVGLPDLGGVQLEKSCVQKFCVEMLGVSARIFDLGFSSGSVPPCALPL